MNIIWDHMILHGKITILGLPDDQQDIKVNGIVNFDTFKLIVTKTVRYPNCKAFVKDNPDHIPRRDENEIMGIYKSIYKDEVEDKWLAIHIEPYSERSFMLYHGSQQKATSASTATLNRFVAASYAPFANRKEMEKHFVHERFEGRWYMIPKHKNALKLLECDGWLNIMEPDGFYRHRALPSITDYISDKDQKVVQHEYIDNVRNCIEGFITILDGDIKWAASAELVFKHKLTEKQVKSAREDKIKNVIFNYDLFKPQMDFVIKKNGEIIDGLDRAKLAAYVGQGYKYIELNYVENVKETVAYLRKKGDTHTFSTDDGSKYDVYTLWILADKEPIVKVPIKKLLPNLDYDGWNTGSTALEIIKAKGSLASKEYKRILNVDTSYPILASRSDLAIIDGCHRLCKLYIDGVNEVDVRFITDKMLKQAKI